MTKVFVSKDSVSRFIIQNNDLKERLGLLNSRFFETVNILVGEASEKKIRYEMLVSRLKAILVQAQGKLNKAVSQANIANKELASTPKTITNVYEDGEGNTVEKEEPNPAYADAQAAAADARDKVAGLKQVVEQISAALRDAEQKYSALLDLVVKLHRIQTCDGMIIGTALSAAERASASAAKVIAAVDAYLGVTVR